MALPLSSGKRRTKTIQVLVNKGWSKRTPPSNKLPTSFKVAKSPLKHQTSMTRPQRPPKSRYSFNNLKASCQDFCREFTALLTTWNENFAWNLSPIASAEFMDPSPNSRLSLSPMLDTVPLHLQSPPFLPETNLTLFFNQLATELNTGHHVSGMNAMHIWEEKTDTTTLQAPEMFHLGDPSTQPLAMSPLTIQSEDSNIYGQYHPLSMMTMDIKSSTL